MSRYYVEMDVSFSGYIEANTEKEAEDMAYTSWGDTAEYPIQQTGVYYISALEEEEEEEYEYQRCLSGTCDCEKENLKEV